jgi:hypothetical protein
VKHTDNGKWDAFAKAKLSPEDECRVFHSFASQWIKADSTLDCRHQARTLCMYHFAATQWMQIFGIVMASKFPLVVVARPKGSLMNRLDSVWRGVVLQTERNTNTELLMGRGDAFRTMFENTVAICDIKRKDHEAVFMAKDERFLVHMFSYSDNDEDFAHRAYTPLLDHGIQA